MFLGTFLYTFTYSAQRLAVQALGRFRFSITILARNLKSQIRRSLAKHWPSRLQPRVGRQSIGALGQHHYNDISSIDEMVLSAQE